MAMEDFLVVGLVIGLGIIFALIFAYANSNLEGTILQSDYNTGSFSYYQNIDQIMIALFFLLYFGILIFAFLFPTNPAFATIGFLVALAVIWIIGNFSSVLLNVVQTEPFNSLPAAANLQLFLQYQPILNVVFIMLFFVIAYGRSNTGVG